MCTSNMLPSIDTVFIIKQIFTCQHSNCNRAPAHQFRWRVVMRSRLVKEIEEQSKAVWVATGKATKVSHTPLILHPSRMDLNFHESKPVASSGQVHIMTNISDMEQLLAHFSANHHLGSFDFKTYLQGHLKVPYFTIFNMSTGFYHFKPFQVFYIFTAFSNRVSNGFFHVNFG